MTTFHRRKPITFLSVVVGSVAVLATEGSAQSASKPLRPLSDAIAEVLRSPFHRNADADAPVVRLATTPHALPGARRRPGDVALLVSGRVPDAQEQPADAMPSYGKMIVNSTIGALVGHGLMWALLWCDSSPQGRFTGPLSGGVGGPSGGSQVRCGEIGRVRTTIGFLTPVATTAGFAYLVGRRAGRALLGSALGLGAWLGSLVAMDSVDYDNEVLWLGIGPVIQGLVAGLVAK